MSHLSHKVLKILDEYGFKIAIVLFLVSSLWLVFSATYPLPFDEYAHYGAIQIYADQWLPFVSSQPIDTGIVGDMTRDPSVLYRWLMSYPYRVMDAVGMSEMAKVIALRLINVGMVLGGLLIFRKLLDEWGLSRRVVNISTLAFAVTPIVPFLAAHINYDNSLFLLTPLTLLYASRIIRSDRDVTQNLTILLLIMLTAITTKQTFAPIALVIVSYVCFVLWRRHKSRLPHALNVSFRRIEKDWRLAIMVLGIALLTVIAIERYGLNLVRYQAIQPMCEEVQTVEFCRQFGPWYRNNVINVENRPAEPPYGNPLSFSQYWITRIYRGYFANFSHTPSVNFTEREPYGPIATKPLLPAQSVVGIVLLVISGVALIFKRREVWSNQMLRFGLVVFGGFIAIQWVYNYLSYLDAWKAEAIQARYTLPVLLLALVALAYAIERFSLKTNFKVLLVGVFLVGYVYGGGAVGWIIRSDETWRWQNRAIQSANNNTQQILKRTVPH